MVVVLLLGGGGAGFMIWKKKAAEAEAKAGNQEAQKALEDAAAAHARQRIAALSGGAP